MNNYEILGLNPNASTDDVKKTYKKLAMQWHPDKNSSPEAPEKFKNITQAYSNSINGDITFNNNNDIGNMYDIFNSLLNEFTQSSGFDNLDSGVTDAFNSFKTTNNIENILDNVFNTFNNVPKGKDILKLIDLTLKDIYLGKTMTISYATEEINDHPIMCLKCEGQGKYPAVQQLGPITMQTISQCERCKGTGLFNLYLPITETVDIHIPRGFNYNQQMILREKGLPKYRYNNGDLVLSFNLLPHDTFKLKNKDLHINVEISLKESLIGFTKNIDHLNNKYITLTSESIIKPNMSKCIDEEGMPPENEKEEVGNMYIKFKIIFPDTLTIEQRKLIGVFSYFLSSQYSSLTANFIIKLKFFLNSSP